MTASGLRELLVGAAPTDQELRILHDAAVGLTARESAEERFLSVETVKDYRKKVTAKIQAKNLCNAVARGIALGWVNVDSIVGDDL